MNMSITNRVWTLRASPHLRPALRMAPREVARSRASWSWDAQHGRLTRAWRTTSAQEPPSSRTAAVRMFRPAA